MLVGLKDIFHHHSCCGINRIQFEGYYKHRTSWAAMSEGGVDSEPDYPMPPDIELDDRSESPLPDDILLPEDNGSAATALAGGAPHGLGPAAASVGSGAPMVPGYIPRFELVPRRPSRARAPARPKGRPRAALQRPRFMPIAPRAAPPLCEGGRA